MKGKVTVIEKGSVKIHTYFSPANAAMNSVHIIESENKLVVIDAQFMRPFTNEAKAYVEQLGKPVERVIVTHSHPDHWFGLEQFHVYPTYALAETKGEIEKIGDFTISDNRKRMKDMVTDKKYVPENVLPEGEETIDGVKYIFEKVLDAEAGVQLLIKLPEQNVLIAQDLVFNKIHLFLGQNAIDGWIKVVNNLKRETEYDTILVGHGENADISIFDNMLKYLEASKEILAKVNNGTELKAKLVERFPGYEAPFLLDISSRFLFNE